jgi:hypothetical protein
VNVAFRRSSESFAVRGYSLCDAFAATSTISRKPA